MTIKIHGNTLKRAAKYGIEMAATEHKVSARHEGFDIVEIGLEPRSVLENCIMKVELARSVPPTVEEEPETEEEREEREEEESEADYRYDSDGKVWRNEAGVPFDGRVAYEEGIMTADCPFNIESDDEEEQGRANQWYEDWDAAADEAENEEEQSGSVVSETYRARYAEAGHPTHCGDWLAETLIDICNNDEGINLELFELVCSLNGVDLSKYNRTTNGWQGRLRMTGRNLLAKVIYRNGGVLKLPEELGGQRKADAEWMASQRYKMPKAEQAKPVPEAKSEAA